MMGPAAKTGNDRALMGILMLETRFPRIPGDIGNPATFSFPVRYQTVAGADPRRVVIDADRRLLDPIIAAARELESSGVAAVAAGCGFLVLFQRELAEKVTVPVFTSSLLQVPLALQVIPERRKVGILTARKASLGREHLRAAGINDTRRLVIEGMDGAEEFTSVFIDGKTTLDIHRYRRELVAAAARLVAGHPRVGAIVLECTNMPPFSHLVRMVTGRPVFDVVTLVRYAHSVVCRSRAFPGASAADDSTDQGCPLPIK